MNQADVLRRTSGGITVWCLRTFAVGQSSRGEINRALTRALERAGLPHIRVHDLRHTVASILLESGVHPNIVQELLGHSTIRLTLDTYSHLTPGLHQQAAQTMDLVLASATR